MAVIGIDLGTTNSLVSYWNGNESILIPNNLGKKLTPSVVGVNDNGEVIVGEIAKERLISHPNMTQSVFKRYMGSDKKLNLGEYEFLPEELSSMVIASLKKDAEIYIGEEVTEAIISVPAYFSDSQRKATKRAGEILGIKVERIVNEPTAAAIAYGIHNMDDETKFLVFDLGGGTFDVSILEIFDSIIEVCAVTGDNFLGGEDFTDIIVEMFLEKNNINKESLSSKNLASLKKQGDVYKERFSFENEINMKCVIGNEKVEAIIKKKEFEDACKPLLNKIKFKIEGALRDANIKVRDIDSVVLIGGATKMPIIHSFVSRIFGIFPNNSINPDETVAKGAGILSGIKLRDSALKEVVLTDVCPYTLGTSVSRRNRDGIESYGHYLPIIDRNTTIPTSKVEKVANAYDNQEKLRIAIYQGESRLVKDNIYLGEMLINIPKSPAGHEVVEIRYTYDINGILEVEAEVLNTGEKNKCIIKDSSINMSDEEIEKSFEKISHLKIHPRDKEENKLLLAKAYRMYEELLGFQRASLDEYIGEFEGVLNSQDDKAIKEQRKKFKEVLERFEGEFL